MPDELTASPLEVRRVAPAYAQVADQLRDLILRGEIEPGERLPNETELSALFGVSRSTVREALRVLSSQQLISTSRGVGGGSFVAHPEPADISEYLEASLGLLSGSVVSVAELLETRAMLEVPAARLAADRRSQDDLEVLRESIERERAGIGRPADFEEHRRFHQALLEATANGLLEIVTRPIFSVLRTRFLREHAPRPFWVQVADEHERILAAIEAADGDAAAAEMSDHLEHLRTTYERIDRMVRDVEP